MNKVLGYGGRIKRIDRGKKKGRNIWMFCVKV